MEVILSNNKAHRFKQMKNRFKQIISLLLILYTLYYILFSGLRENKLCLYAPTVYAAGASFSLSPASGIYPVGKTFNVDINLNTGGNETSGADTILLYEPEKLEAQGLVAGTIYTSYPVKTINSTAGRISISGIVAEATSSFAGEGTFATITFKPLTSGTTTLRFDFTQNEPTDSNVAKKGTQGEDILNSVSNATYTLTGSAATPTPGAGGFPPPPTSGVFEITLSILLAGLIFFASGFFLFLKPAL